MEAFVGALIGTVVQFVADQVNSLLKEKLNEGGEFNEDLVELKNNFTMIKGILHDAAMQQITSVAVTRWLKKLEDAAFEADNALDEFNYHLLRQKAHTPGKRKKDSSSIILGRKIKGINQKLDLINRQATSRGIHQKLIAGTEACSGASASRETDSFTLDPIFIGRDDDVSKIVEILTTPTEEAVSILPIVGMGGLGKTALARKVINHKKTKAYFDQHIWVHVSQSFDAVNLLKKIFTNLNIDYTNCHSKEVLLKSLQKALGFKTYLLVLDDVWNEDWQKWEEFSKSWTGIIRTKGNRIIVTTRSTEVGSLVKTLDTHLLSGLSDEQCCSIIKDRAFEGGDIPPELEVIGRSIAGRCKGLPLAANVVGKMLRGRSQDEWCSIEKEWLSVVGGDENHISKVLKLSYHHLLSPSLKKCFAYCSIFPKGSSIDTKKLIELWMAEGFLQTSDDMENVGNQFLKVLLHNSLLQVVDRDEYGNAKSCSMHDLMHDVARSVLDFPSVNDNEARYIRWTRHINKSTCIPKDQAKWLRTLFYEVGSPDITFSHFESLHALTLRLGYTPVDSIGELIHLRYLHLLGAHHRCLPNSIGELYQLQTLRAEPEKLPGTLTRLINLRHLHVPIYTELPPHLGRLTSLRTLPYFHVRNQNGHRISELGSLKYLKGELMIDNLEKVQGEEDSKKADLSQKPGIVRLALSWSVDGESREGDKNVLNGLQPHTSLMILEIAGFKGASFPLWTSKMAVCVEGHWVGLNNLMEIKLSDCVESEEIPSMGHLPRLKSLYLFRLKNVKSIGSSFYGLDNCKETISVLPALERLELWDMQSLTEWKEVEIPSGAQQVKVFPSLEYLKIRKCERLRCAPSQFTCLKYLIVDWVESGLPLVNICDNKLKTLRELKIGNLDGLTCLPTLLFYNNQHLSMLEIMDCPNLIQLPEGMHRLNCLHELNLQGCNSLRSIPYSIGGGMKSLHRLSIWGCPKLKDFPVESCAPLLKKLRIDVGDSDSWHCESFKKTVGGVLRLGSQSLSRLELRGKDWESLPDQLQHLTSLSKLHLTGFGIKKLPEWFGNLSSLSKLELSHCKKLKRLPSVETMRRLTSLNHLLIDNSPLLNVVDADSEWPKICHLPDVTIDGQQIRRGGQTCPPEFLRWALSCKKGLSCSFVDKDDIWRAMIKDYVQAASVVNLE